MAFSWQSQTHVSTASGNASVLQGLIQARNEDAANASVQETQGAVGLKRTEERLQAIARMNFAWGKAILEHYKFNQVGRITAVSLAQVAQLLTRVDSCGAASGCHNALSPNLLCRQLGPKSWRPTIRRRT